jgi:hypothetical protein
MRRLSAILILLAVVSAVVALGSVYRQAADRTDIESAAELAAKKRLDTLKKERPAEFRGADGDAAAESYLAKFEQEERFSELLRREARERGVKVADSEVDAALSKVKGAYEDTRQFLAAVERRGETLEEYRRTIERQLLERKLMEKVTAGLQPKEKAEKFRRYIEDLQRVY